MARSTPAKFAEPHLETFFQEDTSHQATAARCKALRVALGYTQTAFCRRAGISNKVWSQNESGRNRISIDTANVICDSFGASLDWIFRGDYRGLSVLTAEKLGLVKRCTKEAVAA
jgi:transcriptional regulator with XRE-family HTH domain